MSEKLRLHRSVRIPESWLGRICFTACFVTAVGLSGCGEKPSVTTVTGIVSYQGRNLDHGSLRFYGADGRPVGAVISSDGRYEVELPPGKYSVTVTSPPQRPAGAPVTDDTPPPASAGTLPDRFAHLPTSGISVTVGPPEMPQTFDVELK